MIELLVAPEANRTGKLLAEVLGLQGAKVGKPGSVRVSYGVPVTGYPAGYSTPTLNGNAGKADKYEQMDIMKRGGVVVPSFWPASERPDRFPLLGRKRKHKGGTDIRVILQAEHLGWAQQAGSQFWVEYIPFTHEYRVWIFRDRHLGTYTKVMAYPEMFKKVGCNHKNGFAFKLVNSEFVPRPAVDAAILAVKSLKLDFGAVDIIQGKDGKFYVLEVNTAPGVENSTRQVIQGLAKNIIAWSANPK